MMCDADVCGLIPTTRLTFDGASNKLEHQIQNAEGPVGPLQSKYISEGPDP